MSDYDHLLLHRARRDGAMRHAGVAGPVRRRWTGSVEAPVPTPPPAVLDGDHDHDDRRAVEEPSAAR